MKLTHQAIKEIKKLFICIAKNKTDPTKEYLVEQTKKEIEFEFKIYKIENAEQFAKDNSFCVDCGYSLNDNNECPGCGRAYGW